MKIPSERLPKEAGVGETLKWWGHPDPVKHLTSMTAAQKSEKFNEKKIWKSTFFALTSDFIWRIVSLHEYGDGNMWVWGEVGGLRVKEI